MTEPSQEPLTARQRDVLEQVAQLEAQGVAITTLRLAQVLGHSRQNTRNHLLALRDQGMVRYQAGERFTAVVQLTEAGRALLGLSEDSGLLSFPIVGEVAAGEPGLAEERIEGYAARLQDVLDLHEGDFLLKVRGDSMIGVGIYPGDLVAIRPQAEEPHSGEIALVFVPGEGTATLKRWGRDNGTVTLLSENPAYAPMTFPAEEVKVQGCLVGHIGTGRSRRSAPEGNQEGA
ncbi:transcriptional repressor LexA [Deinococcus aestuarii]|uniref:transcriptional repressor LexA n=1 Tax=Deinococcus aestuarii TaxID=2774531 RepID=UPI001C0D970F|nr:transcriptional repressor LexA [Deinococcus aestuarii]